MFPEPTQQAKAANGPFIPANAGYAEGQRYAENTVNNKFGTGSIAIPSLPTIITELDNQANHIRNLESNFDMLVDRLQRILSVSEEKVASNPAKDYPIQIIDRVSTHNITLIALDQRIQQVTNRLQV